MKNEFGIKERGMLVYNIDQPDSSKYFYDKIPLNDFIKNILSDENPLLFKLTSKGEI